MSSTIIHFEHENLAAYEHQLNGAEVHAATFHPRTDVIHVALNDGRRMTIAYNASEQSTLIAQLHAHHVPVSVAVATTKAKPVHHKLRYIVGGVLVVVIVIVLLVLLLGRRRTIAHEGEAPGAGAS